MLATHRQINTAISNALRLGDIKPDDTAVYRARLAAYTVADLDKVIKAQNARTGWTAAKPATDAQRRYLSVLEKKVFGHIQTMPGTSLTSKDASAAISYLKDVAAQIDARVEQDSKDLDVLTSLALDGTGVNL